MTSGLQCRKGTREELHINFGNSTRLARIDKEHFALDSDYEFFRAAPLNYSRPFPSLAQPGPTNWLGLPRIHLREWWEWICRKKITDCINIINGIDFDLAVQIVTFFESPSFLMVMLLSGGRPPFPFPASAQICWLLIAVEWCWWSLYVYIYIYIIY